MRRTLLCLIATALLAGCNANLGFQFGNSGKSAASPSVGPGGSFSSGGTGVHFANAPGIDSIIGAVGLGWLFGRDRGMESSRPAPAMDENRKVNEQDCGRAVQDPAANLRCR